MYDFVDVPSFVSLITGNIVEPLFFVKINEKSIAEEKLEDSFNHVIEKGERYFKGHYLTLTRSRNLKFKQFQPNLYYVLISPDEIYDTYIDINNNFQLNVAYQTEN